MNNFASLSEDTNVIWYHLSTWVLWFAQALTTCEEFVPVRGDQLQIYPDLVCGKYRFLEYPNYQ